jgi:hypothetical protein
MINVKPGAMAASPTPRKNRTVISPAQFEQAAWHIMIPPHRNLTLSVLILGREGRTYTETARYFPIGRRTII